ncbi:MAG TPA: transporter substrate-binding domain-containing protein [Phycisphaerae bacterium]|nr:transporter substrate-binding domain-containing protein [Phycisphaerae bacterium]
MNLHRTFHRHLFYLWLAASAALTFATCAKYAAADAQTVVQSADTSNHVLIVGTDQSPPFVIYDPKDGTFSGLTIELWKNIARQLGYQYKFRYYEQFDQLLQDTAAGKIDVALSSITVNAQRQQLMDFTEPYFATGLSIAVPIKHENTWLVAARELITPHFLELFAAVGLLLLGSGSLMWLLERKINQSEFRRRMLPGIGDGIWWSAQTMTSVGYGDIVPRTFSGRLVGLFWMFSSVVIISSFTAAITSALTVQNLAGPVVSAADLSHVKVGTIGPGTTSIDYLQQQGIHPIIFLHITDALKALQAGQVDAVVYDTPLLQYQIQKDFPDSLRILPGLLRIQYYALAMPSNNPLRREINFAVLREIYSPDWQTLLTQYLGPTP